MANPAQIQYIFIALKNVCLFYIAGIIHQLYGHIKTTKSKSRRLCDAFKKKLAEFMPFGYCAVIWRIAGFEPPENMFAIHLLLSYFCRTRTVIEDIGGRKITALFYVCAPKFG